MFTGFAWCFSFPTTAENATLIEAIRLAHLTLIHIASQFQTCWFPYCMCTVRPALPYHAEICQILDRQSADTPVAKPFGEMHAHVVYRQLVRTCHAGRDACITSPTVNASGNDTISPRSISASRCVAKLHLYRVYALCGESVHARMKLL